MAKWYTKEQARKFEGVYSLLLTPFTANGQIDWKAYASYVEWQLSHKPQGLFAVCGTSEMKWLTLEERIELARLAVELAGETPVVATANVDPDIQGHKDEMLRIAETGVSGVVLVPPSGMGKDQSRLEDYYARLADAAPCPALVYEWPAADSYLLDAEVYAELANHHNIWGIKDTTCTVAGIKAKIESAPDSVVSQANHPFMLDAIEMGARGIMAISTSACPDMVIDFWGYAVRGDDRARDLHTKLVILDSFLNHGDGYPATAKWIAKLRGVPMELYCRNPVHLKEESVKAIQIWFDSVYGNHHS